MAGGVPMTVLSERAGENLGGNGQVLVDWLAEAVGPDFKPGDVIRRGRYEIAVRRIKRGRIFDAAITDRSASQIWVRLVFGKITLHFFRNI